MNIWLNLLWAAIYSFVGLGFNGVTMRHIQKLTAEASKIDERYGDRLWFTITMRDRPFNRFLVDIIFLMFWPAICIAAILKAEYEYDLIIHRSAFTTKRVP